MVIKKYQYCKIFIRKKQVSPEPSSFPSITFWINDRKMKMIIRRTVGVILGICIQLHLVITMCIQHEKTGKSIFSYHFHFHFHLIINI